MEAESSDLELLRRHARGGDEAAFSELVKRHAGWIFAAARRRLVDEHLADDATQAVFLMLAEKGSQLAAAERQSVAGWLFHVMHFTCGRIRRTRRRQVLREAEAGAVRREVERSGGLPEGELLMLLEDSIAQLPGEDREAVVRRFYRGEDWAEIGAALNLSADGARKRVGRALVVVRDAMLSDGIDVIPDELLAAMEPAVAGEQRVARTIRDNERIHSLAKGAMAMVKQVEAIEFAVMTAELFVKDVEANLDFFEKLGFRRRWAETPDAMGRIPRASLRGGNARIWLRRADETEGTRVMPGVGLFFWIEGGAEGLAAHRDAIVAQGVEASPFLVDHSLRSFTVTTVDGYRVGFFTQYR